MHSIKTLAHRDQLGYWLNEAGLLGVGVEVGTHRGEYAARLASTWAGNTIHTCDPWMVYPEYRDGCILDHSKPEYPTLDMEVLKREAEARLAPFGRKVQIHRVKGARLLMEFANESLDFIHLDGNHSHAAVSEEFRLAWPRLVPGGILSSHDHYDRHDHLQDCGVKSAALEFAREMSLEPYVTDCSSVWFQKPVV